MTDAVFLLRMEHDSYAKVLKVLARERQRLDQGEAVDLELLAEILHYITDFLGNNHHPKEDLIFSECRRYLEESPPALETVAREHEELEGLNGGLNECMARLMAGDLGARQALSRGIAGFVEASYRHMNTEEEQVFPLALEILPSQAWDSIDYSIFDGEDPIARPDAGKMYARLHARIQMARGNNTNINK